MRLRTALLFLVASLCLFPSESMGLEKTVTPAADPDRDPWSGSGTTCTLTYYNTCTGWIWVWSNWESEEVLGVAFENPASPQNFLERSSVYVWTAAPGGWGFTGTISVHEADDNQCPTGPPIESQTFYPVSGWNTYAWFTGVGSKWAIAVTLGPYPIQVYTFPTDRPAGGPTGPQACGFCYPADRPTHSFRWGTAGSPLCPGSPFDDGVCNAELWGFRCTYTAENCGPVPVENESWATIKALYR